MSSKISQYFAERHRRQSQLNLIRSMESIREELTDGGLSDQAMLIDEGQAASADQAASLVHELHDARQLDSDASELREVEINAGTLREAVESINASGGFTLEDYRFAQRAAVAVFHPTPLQVPDLAPAMEGFANGGRVVLSLECIDELIKEVADTRSEIEAGSVDALLRVFKVLNDTMPDVKSRMESLKQVLPDTAYDETAEITLDDKIFQSLAVNGAMPTTLKDYFSSYTTFAKKILAGYSENALETASKASEIAELLTSSRNPNPIDALTEFLVHVGDPRSSLSQDELGFVLPGSGPLFGGKTQADDAADDATAQEGPIGELIVRLRQYVSNNAPLDPMAYSERPSLEAADDEDEDEDEDRPGIFNPDEAGDDEDVDINGDHLKIDESGETPTEPAAAEAGAEGGEAAAGAPTEGDDADPVLADPEATGDEPGATPAAVSGEGGEAPASDTEPTLDGGEPTEAGAEASATPGAETGAEPAAATPPEADAAAAAAENPEPVTAEMNETDTSAEDAPKNNPMAGVSEVDGEVQGVPGLASEVTEAGAPAEVTGSEFGAPGEPVTAASAEGGEAGLGEPGVPGAVDAPSDTAEGGALVPEAAPAIPPAPASVPAARPTMRVLSKDTIVCGLTDLIGVFELVNINTFAEARQPTWVAARSSYNRLQQSLMQLSPATVAELRPLLPELNEFLDVTFTLSAWPALHLLTNAVFTANAFLLLAERSIAGKCEDDAAEAAVPADPSSSVPAQTALPEAGPAGTDVPETKEPGTVDPTAGSDLPL